MILEPHLMECHVFKPHTPIHSIHQTQKKGYLRKGIIYYLKYIIDPNPRYVPIAIELSITFFHVIHPYYF